MGNNILTKCFNCTNRAPCWHITDDLPPGRDPKKIKMKKLSLIKFFTKRLFEGSYDTLFLYEYVCIRSIIDGLNPALGEELSHVYTQQCLGMIESMVNAQNNGWCCPGDDPDVGEEFKFSELKGV